MVGDFGLGFGGATAAKVIYCVAKCGYEFTGARPDDEDADWAFVRCVADCTSPVPLPDRKAPDEDNDTEG